MLRCCRSCVTSRALSECVLDLLFPEEEIPWLFVPCAPCYSSDGSKPRVFSSLLSDSFPWEKGMKRKMSSDR